MIVQFKSHLELVIAIVSIFACTQSWCAPAFPVFYIMMLRLKAGVNSFPGRCYMQYDSFAKNILPSALYNSLIDANRNLLRSISGLSIREEVK